ncbi:MAG TPA: HAD family hydrolase [Puia sp.]|nr:HAD family hydrolase [Puia sp.]
MAFDFSKIDKSWTLFLDRDGVINYENPGNYVRNWNEFRFFPGTPENIAFFNKQFLRVILATNQRGVSRGLMTVADLEEIHRQMQQALGQQRGRIDQIYYCLDMEAESPCRKPNAGMAFQAVRDFPEIDLTKSVMVGNNLSDMGFGRNAGMKTVFLTTTDPEMVFPHEWVDAHYEDLNAFAKALGKS